MRVSLECRAVQSSLHVLPLCHAYRPGNIYFRQRINFHRPRYMVAARAAKVSIAEQVIKEIHDIGGRFLKEDREGIWKEIDGPRAIEKTCQALREKEKCNPPATSPFSDLSRKIKIPSSTDTSANERKRRKKNDSSVKHLAKADASDEKSSSDDEIKQSEGGSDAHSDNDSIPESEDSSSVNSNVTPSQAKAEAKLAADELARNPILRLRVFEPERLVKRLEHFRRIYGHCGVPPGWPRDKDLADWCSAQRQVYREIVQHKYREPTDGEQALIRQLSEMDFIWDYADWHWDDRCRKLAAVIKREGVAPRMSTGKGEDIKKNGVTSEKSSATDVAEEDPDVGTYSIRGLLDWVQDQRRQVRAGETDLPSDRMDRLRDLGIIL